MAIEDSGGRSRSREPGYAQGPAPAPFMAHQLKPNVYWIEGGGGNSGVIIGDKGVIVVDAKTTPAGGKELLDDIAKITPKPVTTVILTHSDGDHVNGLASFPAGITIIAHENNKKEQEAALASGGRGAPPADHLPTQIVTKNKENLKIDGVKLELLHWAPAHTSGDLVVYLPERQDRVHGRHHRHAASRSAHPRREERLLGRLDHDHQGNRRPERRSVRAGTWRCADQGRHSTASDRRRSEAGQDQGTGRAGQVARRGQGCRRSTASAPADGGRGPNFPPYSEVVYNEFKKGT